MKNPNVKFVNYQTHVMVLACMLCACWLALPASHAGGVLSPCIGVTKTCNTVVVGQGNLVTAVVTNCGNVTINNITVSDNLYGPIGTIAALPPSGIATLTKSVTNTCGAFPNTVTAAGQDDNGTPVQAQSTATCVVTEAPCIAVTKNCDTVVVGQANLVTAVVTNCGNVPLHGITIVDNIYGSVGTVALLAPGGTATLTKFVTNTCGTFPNTVTATGLSPCNTTVQAQATAVCTVTENPCISVTKTCNTVPFGQLNTVTAAITNCGNVPIHGITIVDNIYGSVGTVALLAPGGTATLTRLVTNSCGDFPNTVTATGLSPCNTSVQAQSTATCVVTCVECAPDISIQKLVACLLPGAVCPGNVADYGLTATGVQGNTGDPTQDNPAFCYVIIVRNTGQNPLTNIVIHDDKLGAIGTFPGPLAVNGTITISNLRTNWAATTTNIATVTAQCAGTGGNGAQTSATTNAVAFVIPASVSCSMQVTSPDDMDGNPNDGHVSLANNGSPHNVTFTVTITAGSTPLANVTLTSPTLASLGCVLPPPFGLSANSIFTYVCTAPVNCTSIPGGIFTNVAVVSAVADTSAGLCGHNISGQPVSVVSTNSGPPCAVVVECVSHPKICVTKEVACELPTGCGSYSHLATGAKTADNSQCPSFCYRVRVTNCGQEALNNVTVVDNVLALAACNFPTSLAVGQTVECIIAGVVHCDSVTNTVTASGVGASSGIGVSTNDTAAVVVAPIGITANVTANGQSSLEIPCDGQSHSVTNAVEICNTSALPLANITISAPNLVALGGDCTNVASLNLALLPGECTNLTLCVTTVTCPPNCPITLSNQVQITATVDQSNTEVCSWTRNESNQVVAVTASAEGAAVVTEVDTTPPTMTCSTNRLVEAINCAGAIVTYASSATDDCGILSFSCSPPSGSTFPLGVTTVVCTASDKSGNTNSCSFTATVCPPAPPMIANPSVDKASLWPPNHKMQDVTVNYTITGDCTNAPSLCALLVTSNEPINGTGDGDTAPDWEIVDEHHVRLRAERAGTGTGRIYTIAIACGDICGNSTTNFVRVVVAHDIKSPVSGASFRINTSVSFAGTFWDRPGNRHTALWQFDNLSTAGLVTEPGGLNNGQVKGSYKFSAPGVYKVILNIKDQNGLTSWVNTAGDVESIVVIYDPNGGYTIGGGYINSPAGAYTLDPNAAGKLTYGFNSQYFKGAANPKGEALVKLLAGNLEFNALNYEYLSISGAKAQFRGFGKVNGASGYNFIMTVVDGALAGDGVGKFRMKIWEKNSGTVIYDNEPGRSDADTPITPVGKASSVIIKK